MLYRPIRESLTQRKVDLRELFRYPKDKMLKEFRVDSQNWWMATAVRKISVQLKEPSNNLDCLQRKETVLKYSSLSLEVLKNSLESHWFWQSG